MEAKGATFTFAQDNNTSNIGNRKHSHKRHHRRSSRDGDSHNDDHSLDYSASASSSVHSLSSAATGDSTDSSTFADIIRVLDLEDRDELVAIMKKDTKRGLLGNAEGKEQSLGTVDFVAADPEEKSDILQKHAKDRTPKSKNGVRVRPYTTKIKHTIDPFDVTSRVVKNK